MNVEIVSQNDEKMIIKDTEGKVHECDKLFTFDSEETKLSYICYTDRLVDKDGNTIVYAGTYDSTGESNLIKPIQTDKEWEIIQETLQQIVKNVDDDKDGE